MRPARCLSLAILLASSACNLHQGSESLDTGRMSADPATARGRMILVVRAVQAARDRAQAVLAPQGLPAPPRVIDLLTAGDWMLTTEVRKALAEGTPSACGRIHTLTLTSLKGMVLHYTWCLGLPIPSELDGPPHASLPPGSRQEQDRLRAQATPRQLEALREAREAFIKGLADVRPLGADVALRNAP